MLKNIDQSICLLSLISENFNLDSYFFHFVDKAIKFFSTQQEIYQKRLYIQKKNYNKKTKQRAY